MARYCGLCGEMDYSDEGDAPCACARLSEVPPQPSYPEECEGRGHPYYGDDVEEGESGGAEPVGRCYCGKRSYPPGGPSPLPSVGP